jgi:SAM-dependent methyltransferase
VPLERGERSPRGYPGPAGQACGLARCGCARHGPICHGFEICSGEARQTPLTLASHSPSRPAFEPTPSRPPSVSESGPERLLLNVGCGPRGARNLPAYFNSWRALRIDIEPSVQPDILADLTDLSPIETSSADAVWAAHCVEHLYAHEVRIALMEFRRVLRDDGFLCMIVPDLQAVAQYVAADRLHETLYESPAGPVTPHDIFFGFGAAIASGHTSMAHRCGFTPGMLQRCFQGLPFGEVLLRRRSQALELVAVARASPAKNEAERAALMAALEL